MMSQPMKWSKNEEPVLKCLVRITCKFLLGKFGLVQNLQGPVCGIKTPLYADMALGDLVQIVPAYQGGQMRFVCATQGVTRYFSVRCEIRDSS
jgi:hypothetical protein